MEKPDGDCLHVEGGGEEEEHSHWDPPHLVCNLVHSAGDCCHLCAVLLTHQHQGALRRVCQGDKCSEHIYMKSQSCLPSVTDRQESGISIFFPYLSRYSIT